MKVFISHQIKNDEKLASTLLNSLRKRGIDGYMAERQQEYEILIVDKIKKEINSSDYLVGIISKHSLRSPSVHEEIGYAIGLDIPVILMVEESVEEQGVLIHGKETEIFDRKFFEQHSDIIAKHILKKGIPRRKKNQGIAIKKEINQYQQYSPQQRVSKLKHDLIQSFAQHSFSSRKQIIKVSTGYSWRTITNSISILVSENKKTKQRFYSICYDELKTEDDIKDVNAAVNHIFKNLPIKTSWKNICLIISYGNVVKTRISKVYSGIHLSHRATTQNTVIAFDPSIIYYGLGQGKMGFVLKRWNFGSSMPKFFAYGVKSKNDLVARIGMIEDFIEEHPKIFKHIPKLKDHQMKLQIIPEKKARAKREKLAGQVAKRRAKRWRTRLPRRRRGYG